jgi:hypothetical protein
MAENAQTLEIDLNAAVKELRISIEENRKIDPVQVVREYARIAPHHNLTLAQYKERVALRYCNGLREVEANALANGPLSFLFS